MMNQKKNKLGQSITNTLTEHEKKSILKETFISKNIENVSDFLANNFNKLDGFDYRWNSLITSNPLLFEDMDYLRTKSYINTTITEEEISAYKRGDLRELYATFENMLICNLSFYDRIMSFCTMVFLHYVRLNDDDLISDDLDNLPYIFDMTPTQIWCCALTNTKSTKWELEYGWNSKLVETSDNILELNWNKLYKNPIFKKFQEYNAVRCNTQGFRETFFADTTSNRKLAQVCSKFTKQSVAISEESLENLFNYINEQEKINKKLYFSLFECLKVIFNKDESQFAIYVFNNDFFIQTSKFSMKISREAEKIKKDYLGNNYECFIAESELSKSVKEQIEWAKYKLPIQFEFDKKILENLLLEMLKGSDKNYLKIICIRRMNNFGIISKIYFTGIYDNLNIHEDFMFDNRCIRTSKICLSKENAAKYVVDRGYYIFGYENDVHNFIEINKKSLVEYYSKYCITVMRHMSEVITLHNFSKNDIIDVVCSDGKTLNPNKLNNHNIHYGDIKNTFSSKKIMNAMLDKNKKIKGSDNKKVYWKAIE